jgi:hypothetical protein
MSMINVDGQFVYDLAVKFHRVTGHVQFFVRCEDDLCIRARAALGIKGDGHEYDAAYHAAVAEVEADMRGRDE